MDILFPESSLNDSELTSSLRWKRIAFTMNFWGQNFFHLNSQELGTHKKKFNPTHKQKELARATKKRLNSDIKKEEKWKKK